ncbi:hypothetical protein [Tabrizicola sp.]|uniref:hypothetical protein n=1 Tax=Tabrizicola sp. TaxID=2005166 RepID=UPI0025E59232|nr:hypothetical protein [Tabrizicola sp.]
MVWKPEDILYENPPQPRQRTSKLSHVLGLAGPSLETLASAAEELEYREISYVAAFFQLPYPVWVEDKWISVRAAREGLFCDLKFDVQEVIFSPVGPTVARLQEYSDSNLPLITQVTALLPVWGIRSRYHEKYLNLCEANSSGNPLIIPQGDSWVDNRPIRLIQYQTNFAARLIVECQFAIARFLPTYALLSISEALIPTKLFGYCTMLCPGKVVFGGDFIPIYQGFPGKAQLRTPRRISKERMNFALSNPARSLNKFESQLIALERIRSSGEHELALVGTLSLLEWLLKEFLLREHKIKVDTIHKALQKWKSCQLRPCEFIYFDGLRVRRNSAVHEGPPQRQSMTFALPDSGYLTLGLRSSISALEVRQAIENLFEIYRRMNLYTVNSSEPQRA